MRLPNEIKELEAKILIVDDNKVNRKLLKEYLLSAGYTYLLQAANGWEAIAKAKAERPDIILLDIVMPDMNGYEVCKYLKNDLLLKDIPVIFLSSLKETKDKVRAFNEGGVDYIEKPFAFEEIKARVQTHLKIHYLNQDLEKHNRQLEQMVQEKVKEISDSQIATNFAIAHLTEMRDYETGLHLERTRDYCYLLANRLSRHPKYRDIITADFIRRIYETSPLHDIGKVGVPDAILFKPGKLTTEEFEVVKQHTIIGAQTLKKVEEKYPANKFITMGVQIARSHHEKWDGSGYPDGLRGENIPLPARIMALADVYDALRSRRHYKEAFTHEKSREIIMRDNGKQFDPLIVEAFLSLDQEFDTIHRKIKIKQLNDPHAF